MLVQWRLFATTAKGGGRVKPARGERFSVTMETLVIGRLGCILTSFAPMRVVSWFALHSLPS